MLTPLGQSMVNSLGPITASTLSHRIGSSAWYCANSSAKRPLRYSTFERITRNGVSVAATSPSGGCLAQERNLLRRCCQFRACLKSSGKFWDWKFRSQVPQFFREKCKSKYFGKYRGQFGGNSGGISSSEAGKCTRFCSAFQPELKQVLSGGLAGRERTNGETFAK